MFFAPTVDFLDDPPPLAGFGARRSSHHFRRHPPRHGSLGIGSLKGHPDEQPVPRSGSDHRRGVGRDRKGGDADIQAAHRRAAGRRRQRAGRSGHGGDQHRSPARRGRAGRRCGRAPAREQAAGPAAGSVHVARTDIDDVERGSQDSDWDPVKEAAKKLAFVEDRAIFEGYEAASIGGIRNCSSNPALALPEDPREIPDVDRAGAVRAAAGRRRRAVLGAAVGRRVHQGQRDHRARLSDPRAPQPAGRRRHHLGARDRRRVRVVHPRRRFRSAAGHRRVDRLPVARRRHGAALPAGDDDVPVLHRGSLGRARPCARESSNDHPG